jgi:Tfp pilus assembly protein FimT
MIELMVVIFLIGLMATMVLPRMFRRPPTVEWPNILDEMNNLVSFARQEAISNQQNYRLFFKAHREGSDALVVQSEQTDPKSSQKKIYSKTYSAYFDTMYNLAPQVKIVAVYKNGKEVFQSKGEADCFVIPDGLVEDCLVHMRRTYEGTISEASFKMIPFMGIFNYQDGFIRPEK